MKHSEPLILNKEEFLEGFDNPSLQEKVVGVKIALLQNDNGEIGLGLGIEAPPLHSREIEEINRFFAKKYNADEMMQKLLQHYQEQRSQSADSKSQSDQKYEITDIAHPQYPWLHRIRALQDVREDVHQGDLGGFVESERNLSQEGSCWIYDNALAGENSRVIEQSTLHWACRALGSSIISGDARLDRNVWVLDNAIVAAGTVTNMVTIQGDARILPGSGHSSPVIKNDAVIYGTVVGNVEISGFYELPPGEKLENHSREPLKIYANEYTGALMKPREPQKPKGFVMPEQQKKHSDRER